MAEDRVDPIPIYEQTAQSFNCLQLRLRIPVPPAGFALVAVDAAYRIGGGVLRPLPADEGLALRQQTPGVVDFDPQTEAIEFGTPMPCGTPGMPGDRVEGQQLGYGTAPADHKMG